MAIRAHPVDVRIEKALATRPPARAPVSEVEGPAVDMAGILERAARAPHSLRPAEILNLQRTLGNRAVGALLARPAAGAPPIQAKLTVNAPGDEYEQEADRVAEQVMRMAAVQGEEGGPEVMTKPRLAQRGNDSFEVGADLEQRLEAGRGQGQPLPSGLRSEFETKFDADFVGVRVHTDSRSDLLNRALRAEAFTSGQDLFFRNGAYDPGSPTGQRLIAHELTHVIQQNGTTRARQTGSGLGSIATGVKTPPRQQPIQKLRPTKTPVIQRAIGLELEFPIPVDKLGALSPENELLLQKPLSDEGRIALQKSANLDKDETILEDKAGGFKIVVDHQVGVLGDLMQKEPAQVIWGNVLEFIFKPPVRFSLLIYIVLEKIYGKVKEIDTLTSGLSKREKLVGDYYVGPINTDTKPDELSTKSNSLQVNVGVETKAIAGFIGAFAEASELAGEAELQVTFRGYLKKARAVASTMIEQVREAESESDVWPRLALPGLEGIFAVIALYLIAGTTKESTPGTVKNFTPLLLKTPLSDLVSQTLTEKEQDL